jgi:GWxTD domain-containing protein
MIETANIKPGPLAQPDLVHRHKSWSVSLAAFCAFLLVSPALGQVALPRGPMDISLDLARFRGNDHNMLVEFYYAIPQTALTYEPDTTGWKAGVEITLTVLRGDTQVFLDRWQVPHKVQDSSRIVPGASLVGLSALVLGEGKYRVKMTGRDRHNVTRSDSVELHLPITLLRPDSVVMSDIELASLIRQGASKESQFYKNTLEVVPNVDGIYGEGRQCYYYAEAYNILAGGDRSDYVLRTVVSDAIGRNVVSRDRRKKRAGESSVIVDNIAVDSLHTGTYSLVLMLLDSTGNTMSSSAKKFYVYNRSMGVDSTLLSLQTGLSINVFSTMQEAEMDQEFQWARYEATESEKEQYRQLQGVDSKRKFLHEFWRRRPLGTRDEYLRRVVYANSTFHALGLEGYKSDRGRVFIVYGPPDTYDRHPNESETRPYEVWEYNNIQGGVIFVFALRQQGGEYELVHSTHRNELHDESWGRFVLTR